MTTINDITEAEAFADFMIDYIDFKESLSKSRGWGVSMLTLIDSLQTSSYYNDILGTLATDIATLETASSNAVALIDSILAKINT